MLNSYHLARKCKLGFQAPSTPSPRSLGLGRRVQAQGTCSLERKKRVLSLGSSLSRSLIGPEPKASLAHIFSPMGDEGRIHLRDDVMSV